MHLRLLSISLALFGCFYSASAFDLGSALNAVTATQSQPAQEQAQPSLLSALTSQLGITETQAAGGTSAILGDASKNMSSGDWSQLTSAVPALSSLSGSGTSPSSSAGLLGAVMNTATVSDQFKALGLDPSMVQQFIPIILNYVQSEGGTDMMNLLRGAL